MVIVLSMLASCHDHGSPAVTESSKTSVPKEMRNGEKRSYYPSGAVEWQYNYSNDTLEGPAVYFDSLNHKREEHWYSKGVLKSLVVYDTEGFIIDSDFRWKTDELPEFNAAQIELTTADTTLLTETEYKFRVKVPGIPDVYFRTSVTNATLAKASGDLYLMRTNSGPTTCVQLVLSVRDSLKMPFGKRCFNVHSIRR